MAAPTPRPCPRRQATLGPSATLAQAQSWHAWTRLNGVRRSGFLPGVCHWMGLEGPQRWPRFCLGRKFQHISIDGVACNPLDSTLTSHSNAGSKAGGRHGLLLLLLVCPPRPPVLPLVPQVGGAQDLVRRGLLRAGVACVLLEASGENSRLVVCALPRLLQDPLGLSSLIILDKALPRSPCQVRSPRRRRGRV